MRRNSEWLCLCATHYDDHNHHNDDNDLDVDDIDNTVLPTRAREMRPGSGMLRYRQRAVHVLRGCAKRSLLPPIPVSESGDGARILLDLHRQCRAMQPDLGML